VAIALVQSKIQANLATTAGVVTFTSTATAGSLLIVLIGVPSLETATAVTGVWTKDMGGSSSLRIHAYSKHTADGTETDFQWTGSVSQGQAAFFSEWSGISGGVLDQFANGSGTSVTSMSTGTTPTTTAADEVAVTVVACGSSMSGAGAVWTNSFTDLGTAFASTRWGRKILTATGTQESTYGAWTTARTGNSAILTYKAGAAVASLVPPRRSMQHMMVR
jgi:hypothetical protein